MTSNSTYTKHSQRGRVEVRGDVVDNLDYRDHRDSDSVHRWSGSLLNHHHLWRWVDGNMVTCDECGEPGWVF